MNVEPERRIIMEDRKTIQPGDEINDEMLDKVIGGVQAGFFTQGGKGEFDAGVDPFFAQMLDIVSVTCGRGDAAGGGMGLFEVAFLLEGVHFVADGRRGTLEPIFVEKRLASHGLGGLDEVLDDKLENGIAPGHGFVLSSSLIFRVPAPL